MLSTQRITPAMQLALLLGVTGVAILLMSAVTVGLASAAGVPITELQDYLMKPENVSFFRAWQVISSFIMWVVPSITVALISGKDAIGQLGFSEHLNLKLLILTFAMMFAGLYLSGALAGINKLIPLSDDLKQKFDAMEKAYNDNIMAVANMHSFADYFYTLMVVAIAPAIFEEMFFRGCLQQVLVSLTKNAFVGIVIASIIFSLLHGSYYGFFSRVFLGLLLGYIFYYSNNIWYSVFAHLFNNAWGVTSMYMLSKQNRLTPESLDDSFPYYYGIIALVVIIILIRIFKRDAKKFNDTLIATDEIAVD